jgi:hypothetical protein
MTDFIQRLNELLALHPAGRCRVSDWIELKKILKERGYWRKPHKLNPKSRKNLEKGLGEAAKKLGYNKQEGGGW